MAKSSRNKNSKFGPHGNKPLFYPDDDPLIRELIKLLIKRKRFVRREAKHHIKHGNVNYFHTTGVITIDGQGRHSETGAEAFLKLVEARYEKRLGPKINPFENLTLSEKLQTAPIFELSLDEEDDLCHDDDHEQDCEDDLPV
jgi:hypothetical protein